MILQNGHDFYDGAAVMHGRDEGVRFYRRHEIVGQKEIGSWLDAVCGAGTMAPEGRRHRSGREETNWMRVRTGFSGPASAPIAGGRFSSLVASFYETFDDPAIQAGFVLFCGTVHPAAWWRGKDVAGRVQAPIFWTPEALGAAMTAHRPGWRLDERAARDWFQPRPPADPAALDGVMIAAFLPREMRVMGRVEQVLTLVLDPHDLGRHGFGEVMDPVQAAQVLQGAVATRARPELEVDFPDAVRIQAAGFDRRTSFRKMKRD